MSDDSLIIKIMSFNVRYGSANDGQNSWIFRKEMVVEIIKDNNPDIIGLQEDNMFQVDYLLNALPEYSAIKSKGTRGYHTGLFNSIFYNRSRFSVEDSGNFWFSDQPDIQGAVQWDNNRSRMCTWARLKEKNFNQSFYFYNSHLDHKSGLSRKNSVIILSDRIINRDFPDPFLVIGDFNAGERSSEIRFLKGKASLNSSGHKIRFSIPMIDTFREINPWAGYVGTYNGFKGKRNGRKIDYIFIPEMFKTLNAEIIYSRIKGRYPSDHYPVTALISLPIKNTKQN